MKTHFRSVRKPAGFTLVELLFGMVITVIIVGVLVSITGVAIDAWQRGRSEVRASRQAKSLLDTMARDFESLVTRRGDNFEYLYAELVSQLPGPDTNKSANAADLIFFTAATDRYKGEIGGSADRGGDVSCVSYSLVYQDPIKGLGTGDQDGYTFVMYRTLVDPDEAFTNYLGSTSLDSKVTANNPDISNFVCENVTQFTLSFLVDVTQQVNGSSVQVPVRVTLGKNGGAQLFKIRGTGIESDVNTGTLVPVVTPEELKAARVTGVEISVTVLTDIALTKLALPLKEDVKQKLLAKESFQYTRTVQVPGM